MPDDVGDVEDEDVVTLLVVGGAGGDPGLGDDVGGGHRRLDPCACTPGDPGSPDRVGHARPSCAAITTSLSRTAGAGTHGGGRGGGHGRGRFTFPGPVRTEQPRDHAGRECQEEHHRSCAAPVCAAPAAAIVVARGSSPVEPVGMSQDPRGRVGTRKSTGSPAATRRRRSVDDSSRRGTARAYDAPARRDRETVRPSRSTIASVTSSRRSSTRCHDRQTGRDVAADDEEQLAVRRRERFDGVDRVGRAVAIELDPRRLEARRLRRARRRPSRSEPRRARSLGHASATDRPRPRPARGRARAGRGRRPRPSRCPTCTGSNVPPRIPMRSTGIECYGRTLCERRVASARRVLDRGAVPWPA